MKYMLLIYSSPTGGPADGTPEAKEEMEAYFTFINNLAQSGKLVAGEPLEGTETATTVTVRDGKTLTTDGPFAETNEVLGGYFIVEADDLDDALAIGAKIPTAAYGKIEVRPIRPVPGM